MAIRRNSNMKGFEDEILCHTYVSVTSNPIVGNSQPGATFWNTIANQYNANPNITITRADGSLQTRFSTISQSVMLYASKISQIVNSPQLRGSGTNELDWVNHARAEYFQTTGKPFVFDNCYQILKDLPKFDPNTTRINMVNTQRFAVNSPDSASVGSPNSPSGNVAIEPTPIPIDIESPSERPPGRKGEKSRQNKKVRISNLAANRSVVESVEKFTVHYCNNADETRGLRMRFDAQMDELINLRKEEMEVRKEEMEVRKQEIEVNKRKEEDVIMATDTSYMSTPQKNYYRRRFDEIIRRRGGSENSESSSAPI